MELIKRVQFTKEQLIEAAQEDIAAISDALQCYMPCAASKSLQKSLVLKEIALASLNAKPIGAFHIIDQQVGATTDYIKDGEWPISNCVIEVYAAPPAPVVPPEKWVNPDINYAEENGFAEGWNACRAAMLKGGAK